MYKKLYEHFQRQAKFIIEKNCIFMSKTKLVILYYFHLNHTGCLGVNYASVMNLIDRKELVFSLIICLIARDNKFMGQYIGRGMEVFA